VENCSNTTTALEETVNSLEDPERGEDSEDESRDMDEVARALMVPDTPQAPSDGQAPGDITLGAGERVRGAGSFKEEEGKEDEDLGPDASVVLSSVDAESVKGA